MDMESENRSASNVQQLKKQHHQEQQQHRLPQDAPCDSVGAETAGEDELQRTRRRLRKALVVAEKLKMKNILEGEVNKELARRNHSLRKHISKYDARLEDARQVAANASQCLQKFAELTGTILTCTL